LLALWICRNPHVKTWRTRYAEFTAVSKGLSVFSFIPALLLQLAGSRLPIGAFSYQHWPNFGPAGKTRVCGGEARAAWLGFYRQPARSAVHAVPGRKADILA
jgi:hypothetical protein